MERRTRIVVVDDYRISREFLRMYAQSSNDNELVGAFSSAEEAVRYCDRDPVDLVVMDVMMRSGIDGLTAAGQIKQKHPQTKILLVTSMAESTWETKARELGVEGFWYKEYSPEPLETLIRRIASGETCYPETVPDVSFGYTNKLELTDREQDVLRELVGGSTNEEIAQKLDITVNTVKFHIRSLLNKTGYENRLALAVHARGLGIVVSENDRRGSE